MTTPTFQELWGFYVKGWNEERGTRKQLAGIALIMLDERIVKDANWPGWKPTIPNSKLSLYERAFVEGEE